ncbi:hypothetical protein M3603_07850 [Rummeliibacillus stabekisii]|nr:hypothetical protein [Rummeliibacillus stabekisii]MCM3316591.1 hypothetical protein [Rummeliibacillus stabekisii]
MYEVNNAYFFLYETSTLILAGCFILAFLLTIFWISRKKKVKNSND